MTDLDSLESVLGDDGEAADLSVDEIEQEEQADTDAATGDETNTEAPPAEDAQPADKPKPDPKSDDDTDGPWTKQTALDERRKRQDESRKRLAAEQRVAELEARLNSDAAPKQPVRPDVFEDQAGAFRHIEQTIEAARIKDRVDMSVELMRDQFPDYDELEAEFIDLAIADPSLADKMRAAPLPAKFAYNHVKKHRQLQEMQDVDAYKAKLEAEVRAKILAELEAERSNEEAEAPAPRTPHPPQLVNRRSADKAPQAHESLEEIFGGM